jgi:hypothetical protein
MLPGNNSPNLNHWHLIISLSHVVQVLNFKFFVDVMVIRKNSLDDASPKVTV